MPQSRAAGLGLLPAAEKIQAFSPELATDERLVSSDDADHQAAPAASSGGASPDLFATSETI
jgi:hypothetical protein